MDRAKRTASACTCGLGAGQDRSSAMKLHCYRIRACPFGDSDPASAECPPRHLRVGCWEVDWAAIYREMPEGAERDEWRQALLDACPDCEVYALHEEAMHPRLIELERS